jgi:radical SAM protein with 4Fe4S-binding SPASM domain
MGFGIRDGNGIIFVSHLGDVYPAGFLPLGLGNVKTTPLPAIYRQSGWLARLRDMDAVGGKCGRCEHRWLCGGSRSRAYAMTGDPMAADPLCGYEPV